MNVSINIESVKMISPQKFLKARLSEIFNQVKTINIRYQYSKYDDTHMIEVTPLTEYNGNELYQKLEKILLFEFNDKFFPSTILFLTEGSLNEITSADIIYER